MFTLGLTPSLIYRGWFYQGVVSGLAAGIGYGIGVFAHWVWTRYVTRRTLLPRWAYRVALALLTLWVLVTAALSRRWQIELAAATGAEANPRWWDVLNGPVAILVFLALVALARSMQLAARGASARLPERFTPRARTVTSWVAVLIIAMWTLNTVVPGAILWAGEQTFSSANASADEQDTAPVTPLRSGSSESYIDFDTVGNYGARFLNQGYHAELTHEPIRLYAGLESGGRAQLLIDELTRTEATDREAILIVMPTGTGWVNHQVAQAFEILYDGNTATVAAQYSYLPSAFHFIAGGEAVSQAGEEWLTPLIDWWNDLDPDTRPELYLYGESLGTTGIEVAFSSVRDVVNSVDGILLTGPPNFNPLWSQLTEERDSGSPEIKPKHADQPAVHFANTSADARALYSQSPNLLYVQRPSDPIVWWSPELIFTKPDWLEEEPGYDRSEHMRWIPFITFLQVSADLPVSQQVGQSHGHNYGDTLLDGLAAIAEPGRFSPHEVDELRDAYRSQVARDAR